MDLNLLFGLDALLENRSVQDAAAQMRLTPPAVSRILARLRAATGDEILVRDGRQMIPTARALHLQAEVRDLVDRARAVLAPARAFELSRLERTFVLRCHEALLAPVAAHLAVAVAEKAPSVQLRFVGEKPDDDRDLTQGRLDLEIGNEPRIATAVSTEVVSTEPMRLIVRRDSALDVAFPTPEAIARALHVTISRRGRVPGPLDDHLSALGLRRRVIASVPTVAAALAVLEAVSSVTTIPERLTRDLPVGLVSRPLPFSLMSAPVVMSWHRRHDADPAHTWLRHTVAEALAPPPQAGGAGG